MSPYATEQVFISDPVRNFNANCIQKYCNSLHKSMQLPHETPEHIKDLWYIMEVSIYIAFLEITYFKRVPASSYYSFFREDFWP